MSQNGLPRVRRCLQTYCLGDEEWTSRELPSKLPTLDEPPKRHRKLLDKTPPAPHPNTTRFIIVFAVVGLRPILITIRAGRRIPSARLAFSLFVLLWWCSSLLYGSPTRPLDDVRESRPPRPAIKALMDLLCIVLSFSYRNHILSRTRIPSEILVWGSSIRLWRFSFLLYGQRDAPSNIFDKVPPSPHPFAD